MPAAAARRPEQGGGEGEGLGVCLQRSRRRRRGAGQVHLVSGNYIIASFDSNQGCLILKPYCTHVPPKLKLRFAKQFKAMILFLNVRKMPNRNLSQGAIRKSLLRNHD